MRTVSSRARKRKLEAAIEKTCREWWSNLDEFMKSVLENPKAQTTLFRMGFEMLRRGMDAAVCLEILQRVNETLPTRCLYEEVEQVAIRAADEVSVWKRRHLGPNPDRSSRFGRPALEEDPK